MKMFLLFTLLATSQVLATSSYAQEAKISIDLSEKTIADVLNQISSQSEFDFFYNNKLIDVEKNVSIQASNEDINVVLDKLFNDTDVSYIIEGKRIILSNQLSEEKIQQESKTITGNVVNSSGEPVTGATVVIKGTTQGTITQSDGSYTLENVNPGDVIVFSFIGMSKKEVTFTGQETLNIELEESNIGLEEIVAIGYGTTSIKDVTGAVSNIRSEDFNNGMVASPEQLIQGRSPGVQITSSSGEPGGSININIRGTSSVRTGNNPLYVVDGVPLSGDNVSPEGDDVSFGASTSKNPLNFLNPADIKDISILKDASATAIYGSRGANGVVIITTKSGSGLNNRLEYSSSVGFSTITQKYDVLDAGEYLQAIEDLGGNPSSVDGGANTDWQDQILRTGIAQKHNVAFGNSNEYGNYRASLSYFNQEGIIKESSLERYTIRVNGSRKYFDDKLKLESQLSVSNIEDANVPIGNNASHYGDLIASAIYMNPSAPVKTEEGELNQKSYDQLNPVAMIEYSADNTNTLRALVSLSAEYQFTEALSFKSIYGYDASKSEREYAYSPLLYANYIYENGKGGVNSIERNNRLWENYLNYEADFGEINVSGLLGYSYQKYVTGTYSMSAGKFRVNELNLMMNNIASAQSIVGNSSYQIDELQSFFTRINFSASDKFLFTATMRADGSTRFGGNNKYGYFPSMAMGYRLSEEDFIPESISNLKVRLGWGVTGNQEIPHNLYTQRQRFNSSTIDGDGDIIQGTVENVTFANPDLKWETTTQYNAGIDFGFAGNKISGALDVYRKKTTDLLLRLNSAQPAPQAYYWSNLDGDIYNTGVEFSLTANIADNNNFSWNVTGNASYNKNIVKNLSTTIQTGVLHGQGLSNVMIQRITNNQPMYVYYIRKFEGFDENGISMYNIDSPEYTGESPIPKVSMGLTNSFKYKNFDLNAYFNGQFGHKIYSNTGNAFFYKGSLANGRNVTKDIISNGESPLNTADPSTRFLEDGSFVRLQDLTLGYNIPLKRSKGISNLRLYVTGQNLFIITNYSGQDPEVDVNKSYDGVPSKGIDYTAYPRSRTILAGFVVKF